MLCLYKTMLVQLSFLTTEVALLQTTMSEFAHPLSVLRGTQPTIEVENTVISKSIGSQENRGIRYLSRMCYAVKRRIF